MQNLSLHIEYLLRYHDCVILPGIGAFLRQEKPAQYRQEDGALIPGEREICFNRSITADDGLLTHSISRRARVGFEEARVMLSADIEAMREALSADGELALGRVGRLCLDNENNISFIAGDTAAFQMPVLLPYRRVKKTEPVKEEVMPMVKPYFTLRIPKRVVRYAAVIAVIIAGCMALSVPGYDTAVKVDQASVLPVKVAASKQPQSETVTAPAADKQIKPEKSERYYLIVGANHSMAKCEDFMDHYPDVELHVIPAGKTRKLIYIAASSEREELLDIMRDSEVKERFGQTWIYDSEK